jgi:hypothetical protein
MDPSPHPRPFGGPGVDFFPGRGPGELLHALLGAMGALLGVVIAITALIALAAFLVLLVRFLIAGTRAADLYVATHRAHPAERAPAPATEPVQPPASEPPAKPNRTPRARAPKA